jgi:acetyl-CoA acyltransferase 1
MAHRLRRIVQHLIGVSKESASLTAEPTAAQMSTAEKSDDDVVICCAVRTAVTKAKKGGFRNTPAEDMLAPLFKAIIEKTKLDPAAVGDTQIGNVLMPGSAGIAARQGQLMGGIPYTVPILTINRQCSSGLQTVANVAANIKAGTIDIGIAGGVESMSMFDMMSSLDPSKISEKVFETQAAADCMTPMGITSENVAEKYGISRETQDTMAANSHRRQLLRSKVA